MFNISGRVDYEFVPVDESNKKLDYNNSSYKPVRKAKIELLKNQTLYELVTSSHDATPLVNPTTTSEDGTYWFDDVATGDYKIRIYSQSNQTNCGNYYVADNDTNDNIYYVEKIVSYISDQQSVNCDLSINSGWNNESQSYISLEQRKSGTFAILDSVKECYDKCIEVSNNIVFPQLKIYWNGNGVGTYYTNDKIYILGVENVDTDEYDVDVVTHEWCHYFEDNFSRSDSIGGRHGIGDRLDMRLAFGEGLGNAFSGIIGNSIYIDTYGSRQNQGFTLNLETGITYYPGWWNETTIYRLLYDLFDNPTVDDETLSIGFDKIFNVLTSDLYKRSKSFTSIFLFIYVLKKLYPTLVTNIDNYILDKHNLIINDEWGTNMVRYNSSENVYTEYDIGMKKTFNLESQYKDTGRSNLLSTNFYLKFKSNNMKNIVVKHKSNNVNQQYLIFCYSGLNETGGKLSLNEVLSRDSQTFTWWGTPEPIWSTASPESGFREDTIINNENEREFIINLRGYLWTDQTTKTDQNGQTNSYSNIQIGDVDIKITSDPFISTDSVVIDNHNFIFTITAKLNDYEIMDPNDVEILFDSLPQNESLTDLHTENINSLNEYSNTYKYEISDLVNNNGSNDSLNCSVRIISKSITSEIKSVTIINNIVNFPCFTEGTKILTSNGYKNVEHLSYSDLIITNDDRNVSINNFYTSNVKVNKLNAPYIIPKNYFSEGYPSKSFKISPDHAIAVDKRALEWFIPKIHGKNLQQDFSNDKIKYYHIELPNWLFDHIIIENGTIVESYGKEYHKNKNLNEAQIFVNPRTGYYIRFYEKYGVSSKTLIKRI